MRKTMRKNLKYIIKIGLLFSTTLASHSYAESENSGEIKPRACGGDLVDILNKVHKETRLLKIAANGADIKRMELAYTGLNNQIAHCIEKNEDPSELGAETLSTKELTGIAMVCNGDCHYAMADYMLFLAQDFNLLSSKENAQALDASTRADWARKGHNIIDRGIRVLAYQQKGTSGGDDNKKESFNEYSRRLAQLNMLKLRLYIAAGDAWYKGATELSLKKTNFMLSEALPTSGQERGESDLPKVSDDNLKYAMNNYVSAQWALIEAKTDLPLGGDFEKERHIFMQIKRDLDRRADSVKKGHLFLGIDPEVDTEVDIDRLLGILKSKISLISRLEEKIESNYSRSQNETEALKNRQLDEKRFHESKSIALHGHKIASLNSVTANLNNKLSKLSLMENSSKENFSYNQQIQRLKFEFAKAKKQLDREKTEIEERKAQSLLLYQKQSLLEERQELRWKINWTITELNLDMQIAALKSELYNLKRQMNNNSTQIEVLTKDKSILEKENTYLANANTTLDKKIENAKVTQTTQYDLRVEAFKHQICSMEAQMIYLKGKDSFTTTDIVACENFTENTSQFDNITKVCELQANLAERKEELLEKLASCDGVLKSEDQASCDFGDGDAMTHAQAVFDKQKDIIKGQYKQIRNQIKHVKTRLREIEKAFDNYVNETSLYGQIVLRLKIAANICAGVPQTATGPNGVFVENPTGYRAAMTALTGGIGALQMQIQRKSTRLSQEQTRQGLRAQIKTLISSLEGEKLQDQFLEAKKAQLFFQMTRQGHERLEQAAQVAAQAEITQVQCDGNTTKVDATFKSNLSSRDRLVAELKHFKNNNAFVQTEINNYNREKANNDIRKDQNLLRIGKIDQQIAKFTKDTQQIAILMSSISGCDPETHKTQTLAENFDHEEGCSGGRMKRVGDVKEEVRSYAQQSQNQTRAIDEVTKLWEQGAIAALDGKKEFITDVLNQKKSQTDLLIDNLNGAIGASDLFAKEKNDLLESLRDVQRKIKTHADAILDEHTMPDTDEKARYFLAKQENIADIVQGVPEFIRAKRNLMEDANLVLNQIRSRFNRLGSLMGPSYADLKIAQPQTASAFQSAHDSLETILTGQLFNKQVSMKRIEIAIPGTSALARELSLKGEADFSIGYIGNDDTMASHGHYRLWNEGLDKPNTRLIDMRISANSGCQDKDGNVMYPRPTIIHNGEGWIATPLFPNSPSMGSKLVFGNAKSYETDLINISNTTEENKLKNWFIESTWKAKSLKQIENDVRNSLLPLLGKPVQASYKIILDDKCAINGTSLKLYLVIARYNEWL